MSSRPFPLVVAAAVAAVAAFAFVASSASAQTVGSLELIGQTTVPFEESFAEGPVIGISGLTHVEGDTYYGVSDDTEDSLYYVIEISGAADPGTEPTLAFTERRRFENPESEDGRFAPGSLDPEGIAYDERNDTLIWVSESRGEANTPVFMHETELDGSFVREVAIDTKYDHTIDQGEDGTRTQGIFASAGFESLTFVPDYSALFAAPEDTLVQDGVAAKRGAGATGRARIIEYTEEDGAWTPNREFVYEVSPREDTTSGDGANSLVDLLAIDGDTLLALEREWPDTPGANPPSRNVKIFAIELDGATDVIDVESLDGADFTPVSKRLLLDMDDLVAPDNGVEGILSYEAMVFGPELPDGRRTLIMLNDNDGERDNQLLVFAVDPA